MDINKSEFGFVVMVRDLGQDALRKINRVYPDHPAAICVKHNLHDTGRYNSVFVREATKEDVACIEECEHDWQEQPGFLTSYICSRCGQERS